MPDRKVKANTILPEYTDYVDFGSDGAPYTGDRLVLRVDAKNTDELVELVLRFSNGRLDGPEAVSSVTGYGERWKNGRYLSSWCFGKRPEFAPLNRYPADYAFDLEMIRSYFTAKSYWNDREDPSDFLPGDSEELIVPELIEPVKPAKRKKK
jgi:hypothetical protein